MSILFVLLCLLIPLLSAPVQLAFHAAYAGSLTLTLGVSIYRFRLPQQTLLPAPQRKSPRPANRSAHLAALRTSRLLPRLQRHLRPQRLRIAASISLGDAARSARLCAALNTLSLALPAPWRRVTQVQVLPDFWSGSQTMQAECIFSSRLGMLMADAAVLWLHQRKVRSKGG